MERHLRILPCLAAAMLLLASCTAAGALGDARASLARAKEAGVDAKAPYEYSMAEAYLEKAQHETDEGDSTQAGNYARESSSWSQKAIEKTGGAR